MMQLFRFLFSSKQSLLAVWIMVLESLPQKRHRHPRFTSNKFHQYFNLNFCELSIDKKSQSCEFSTGHHLTSTLWLQPCGTVNTRATSFRTWFQPTERAHDAPRHSWGPCPPQKRPMAHAAGHFWGEIQGEIRHCIVFSSTPTQD